MLNNELHCIALYCTVLYCSVLQTIFGIVKDLLT
jgi:hypothetical protein